MTLPAAPIHDIARPISDDLGALWRQARAFGSVQMFNFDDGRVFAKITLPTIAGTALTADSGHKCHTPEDALIEAIAKAETIRAQFK
ncbi:MAG: hypothetical protein V4659_04070 [Pseudomonadota bacterium]